uniref:HDC01229 n=1 Tax=Drosophila melanogaster TaxID=7227 RepID=Q6IHS6_DROME|nr:TPA_inf: HDC01229 [Drosophila melanogaster]
MCVVDGQFTIYRYTNSRLPVLGWQPVYSDPWPATTVLHWRGFFIDWHYLYPVAWLFRINQRFIWLKNAFRWLIKLFR